MNKLFSKKIQNIHSNLMECYRDSQFYSPSITGAEREIFNRELFQRILPSNYRVGAGTIVDSQDHQTGQIDAVIELPFSLSLPISSGENRLYMADTIGAAFEIKSDLHNQWDDAIAKIIEIKQLNRFFIEPGEFAMLDTLKIPAYIIAFTGPKKLETIYKRLESVAIRDRPDGIFIIEHGTLYGRVPGGNSVYEVHDPQRAILAFISTIYRVLQQYSSNTVDIDRYQNLL